VFAVVVKNTMAISVETIPSSTRTYSGVINSVLIQTEDGRRFDSSIQYNRIRDYHHHFQYERPRFAKPLILLGLAIFVAVWLFSESTRFAVFPLTVSNHKFDKPNVENIANGDGIESLHESESTDDEIDALNGDDDLQTDSESDDALTKVEDHYLNDTSSDDDDVLGEDDNFEGGESQKKSKKESDDKVSSATHFTNTSAATPTIGTRVNATKYNL